MYAGLPGTPSGQRPASPRAPPWSGRGPRAPLYYIVSYYIILYDIVSYHIISDIILYHILYDIVVYCSVLYYIISYHIISYNIISDQIISHTSSVQCSSSCVPAPPSTLVRQHRLACRAAVIIKAILPEPDWSRKLGKGIRHRLNGYLALQGNVHLRTAWFKHLLELPAREGLGTHWAKYPFSQCREIMMHPSTTWRRDFHRRRRHRSAELARVAHALAIAGTRTGRDVMGPADCEHYNCNHALFSEFDICTIDFSTGFETICGYSCSGYLPMKSEPPTPTWTPDKQFRNM